MFTYDRTVAGPRFRAGQSWALAVFGSAFLSACGGGGGGGTEAIPPPAVDDVQVGDPGTCYDNPEFSRDGTLMVWFEPDGTLLPDGNVAGKMWQCNVDLATGEFVPNDCRGFSGFDTTLFGRAYIGKDVHGLYYVGQDPSGQLVKVQPTAADDGIVTALTTPADTTRRGIYSSTLPDSPKNYVYWLRSNGSLYPQDVDSVDLQYIDLDDPTNIVTIEHQDKPPGDFTAIDVAFPRYFAGTSVITYGRRDANGFIQVMEVDLAAPNPVQITSDPHDKVATYPFEFQGTRYLASGVDHTSMSELHAQMAGSDQFEVIQTFEPITTDLANPCQAASQEPYFVNDELFMSFQLTDCSRGSNFLTNTGEIWVARLLQPTVELTEVSRSNSDVKNEPEPVVGTSKSWVFYTAYPDGSSPLTACYEVRRAAAPE
jgi:hypothetical protein